MTARDKKLANFSSKRGLVGFSIDANCKKIIKLAIFIFIDWIKLSYFRLHPTPVLSQTLLVPNFFSHFLLQESLRDEYDMDLGLEYEKSELQIEFLYVVMCYVLHICIVQLELEWIFYFDTSENFTKMSFPNFKNTGKLFNLKFAVISRPIWEEMFTFNTTIFVQVWRYLRQLIKSLNYFFMITFIQFAIGIQNL